jgi:hypothetical protein
MKQYVKLLEGKRLKSDLLGWHSAFEVYLPPGAGQHRFASREKGAWDVASSEVL